MPPQSVDGCDERERVRLFQLVASERATGRGGGGVGKFMFSKTTQPIKSEPKWQHQPNRTERASERAADRPTDRDRTARLDVFGAVFEGGHDLCLNEMAPRTPSPSCSLSRTLSLSHSFAAQDSPGDGFVCVIENLGADSRCTDYLCRRKHFIIRGLRSSF